MAFMMKIGLLLLLEMVVNLSADGFGDHYNYKYCSSQTLYGNEVHLNWARLAECNVIEGHLRIHRAKLHEGAYLNLTEVTDYVILEGVEGLISLSSLFPILSVIRGETLFLKKYGLVLVRNGLEEIGSWNMKSIGGSVYVEDNIFLCADENQFKKITSVREANFFNNNMPFCPFVGCEEKGYCDASEKTCKTLGLPCAMDTGCHSECVGGCYMARDPFSCVACKNFVYNGTCVETCPTSTLLYMNNRCITYEQCMNSNYTVLNPEDTAFLSDGTTSEDLFPELNFYRKNRDQVKCVKRCPEKFIVHLGGVRTCKLERVCETTTLTHLNLGKNLKYCTHIDGNLIIMMITGGRNVSESLESNLGMIETVSGYVKVAGASTLYSLSFLRNLKSIEGKEKFLDKYTLYIAENENLVELFDREIRINGSALIKHNDKLCNNQIATWKKSANISDDRLSSGSNGKHAACEKFHTHLKAVPGRNNGSVLLQWFHMHCGVNPRSVIGYTIFYRIADHNLSKYQGRDACNDEIVWSRVNVELEVLKTAKCLNYELCLMPNKRYAIYVQSLTVKNVKVVVESDIVFVRTYNDIPEEPSSGTIRLRDNGFVLSFEPSSLHTYFNRSELFYEMDIVIEDDWISDEVLNSDDDKDEESEVEAAENSSPQNICPCTPQQPINTYLLQDEKRQSIEIAHEISKLRYYRIIESSKPSSRNRRSVSTTSESTESTSDKKTCVLQSKPAKFYNYENEKEAFKKTCEMGRAHSEACQEPSIDWSSSAAKFKRAIVPSRSFKIKDKKRNNILKISENSSNTSIYIRLPTDYQVDTKPRRITAKVRSCVGRMKPCHPLNISDACAICSGFLKLTTHTVPSFIPKISVQPYRKLSKPEKSRFHYIKCGEEDRSAMYVDRTLDEILEEIRKSSPERDDSKLEFLNITWTDPLSVAVVGYRIYYRRMDVQTKETLRLFINKTEAERRDYHLSIPVDPSLKATAFLVGFQIRFKGDYSRSSIKCVSIPWNESIDLFVYFVVAIVAALATLTLVALYKISRGMLNMVKKKPTLEYSSCYNAEFSEIKEEKFLEPGKIILKKEIGRGKFGKVYFGYILQNEKKTAVTVKITKPRNSSLLTNADKMKQIVNEAVIMKDFDCAFVVHLIGLSYIVNDSGEPELLIVIQRLYKDLETYLKETEELEIDLLKEILTEVAAGLDYLHGRLIIHRDIAARNVLIANLKEVTPRMHVKIADFGLARQYKGSHYEQMSEHINKESDDIYIPPESSPQFVSESKMKKYCPESDVYSFGILIGVLFYNRRKPYSECTNVVKLIKKGIMRISEKQSKSLSYLMRRCLSDEPAERIKVRLIIEELLPELCPEFKSWFKPKCTWMGSSKSNSESTELDGGFASSLCTTRSSKTDSEVDEGCPSSSLDASQEDNDLYSATPRTFGDNTDGPYDDMACLTPKDGGRNRASRLAFGSLSCGKKNDSDDDE